MATLEDIDYPLPEHLIAEKPAGKRDESRLLVVSRADNNFTDKKFSDVAGYFREGDCLVFNATRVIKARLKGETDSGRAVEILLIEPVAEDFRRWKVLLKGSGKIKPGETGTFGTFRASFLDRLEQGERLVEFDPPLTHEGVERTGFMPVPPYIVRKRETLSMPAQLPEDDQWYQTIFAKFPGSVAAPTAALHFTGDVMDRLKAKGVDTAEVVLHVGPGTFRPVEGSVEDYRIHSEWIEVPESAVETVRRCKERGGRVFAVGTTTTRALETASAEGALRPFSGYTDLFVKPPYKFRMIDALITNFHMPRSTLLLLVYAFAGMELTRRAYTHAVEAEYRFYSYGDAMLIL